MLGNMFLGLVLGKCFLIFRFMLSGVWYGSIEEMVMSGRAETTRPAQHRLRNGRLYSQVFCGMCMYLFWPSSECGMLYKSLPNETSVVPLRPFAECRPAKSRHKLFGQKLSHTPTTHSTTAASESRPRRLKGQHFRSVSALFQIFVIRFMLSGVWYSCAKTSPGRRRKKISFP